MAIIKKTDKTGKKRYLVRVRDRYRNWYPSETFDRRVDAEAYERKLLLQKDENVDAKQEKPRSILFSEFCLKWATENRANISAGWKVSQDQMLKDYIIPALGKHKLQDIVPEHIGQILFLMEKKKGLSAQTRLHVYNLLHRIFVTCVEYYGYIDKNPVLKRDRPRVLQLHERRFLSPADAKKLLDFGKEHFLGPAIWICTLAGLRPNEVQALRWDSVDFEKGQILIKAGYKRKAKEIEPYPKQRKMGMAPLPEVLGSYLQSLYHSRQNDETFVAPGPNGGMLSYHTFIGSLKRLCKACGLTPVSPHELRHSCTELWVEQGATEEDLVRLLNHSGSGSIRRYIHPSSERLQNLGSKIEVPAGQHSQKNRDEKPRLRLIKN